MIYKGEPRFNYKDKHGMSIDNALSLLHSVEKTRHWMEVDSGTLDIRGGQVKVGRKKVGKLTPFTFQQLRRQVGARSHQLMDVPKYSEAVKENDKDTIEAVHREIVTERLRDTSKRMFLRVQRAKDGDVVLTALTDKYEHLPYAKVLEAFPKSLRVYRVHVDYLFLSLHVSERSMMSSELKAGFRVTSSDIGAAKLRMAFQLFRVVCTNGLMTQETIFDFKKMHTSGVFSAWKETTKEWMKRLPEFKKRIYATLKAAEKRKVTAEQATDELLDMAVPRKRIERALQIAAEEFGSLNRWSVANGLSQVSHEDRPGNKPVAISTGSQMDHAAMVYMGRA